MTRRDHEVRCMALRQLETACLLYEQQDYYSVITLAGAAEEIFENLLMDKLLEELKPLLIGPSGDAIGQLPKKIQEDSSTLAKHIKELKAKTVQLPKAPEETWDETKMLFEAQKVIKKLKKDRKRLEDICIEKLPRSREDRRRQRSSDERFLNNLGEVLRRHQSFLDSFSASVLEVERLSPSPGEEKEPTESDVRRRANWVRNRLKHWFPGQPNVFEFDAAEEAKDMLDRAIANYYALTSELTDAMRRFQDRHVHNNKQIRP